MATDRADPVTQPLVSIITPVLNGGKYLDRLCVQSVLNQDYPSIEHVLVDGGSTDGTVELLSSYSAKYPGRIKFISAPGTGAGEAWNIGLKNAKGDIFLCLGADDTSEPGAIRAVVEFFRSNPEAHFVHGHADYVDVNGEFIRRHRANGFNLQDFVDAPKHIAITSAFYRRAVMEKIGWLDSSGDDFDVLIRIAREFQIYQIDQVLSKITLRPGSAFSPVDLRKREEVYRDTYRVSRRYGGSAFSKTARRYYRRLVFNRLHLGAIEPHYLAMRRWMERLGGNAEPGS